MKHCKPLLCVIVSVVSYSSFYAKVKIHFTTAKGGQKLIKLCTNSGFTYRFKIQWQEDVKTYKEISYSSTLTGSQIICIHLNSYGMVRMMIRSVSDLVSAIQTSLTREAAQSFSQQQGCLTVTIQQISVFHNETGTCYIYIIYHYWIQTSHV